jgi:hypothetical protein
MWKLAAARLDERPLGRDAGIPPHYLVRALSCVAQSHCRTAAREQATRASNDSATVRECWRKRARAECGRLNPRWAMAWTRKQTPMRSISRIATYISVSRPPTAMPCHVLPGSALLVTPSHQAFAFAFPSTCLYSTYRPAGFGLGAQFGEERGYISLFSVHDSRATPINQGGIQGGSQLAAIRPSPRRCALLEE